MAAGGWVNEVARRGMRWLAGGLLLAGLMACGSPALTPLQLQYQREEERALRAHARGELSHALVAYQNSLRWAEVTDDQPAMTTQALNVGAVALALGDWALAERSFRQAQRLAAALSNQENELRARLGLAQVRLRQGRFEVARQAFQQALHDARGGDAAAVLVALNGLGLAYQKLGQPSAAQAALAEAERLARGYGDRRLLAATLANRAALALRGGDVDQAARDLEEAIELDRAAENLPGLAHDLLLFTRVRQRQGDASAASALERQAQIIIEHTGQPVGVDRSGGDSDLLERESDRRSRRVWLKSDERDGFSE